MRAWGSERSSNTIRAATTTGCAPASTSVCASARAQSQLRLLRRHRLRSRHRPPHRPRQSHSSPGTIYSTPASVPHPLRRWRGVLLPPPPSACQTPSPKTTARREAFGGTPRIATSRGDGSSTMAGRTRADAPCMILACASESVLRLLLRRRPRPRPRLLVWPLLRRLRRPRHLRPLARHQHRRGSLHHQHRLPISRGPT